MRLDEDYLRPRVVQRLRKIATDLEVGRSNLVRATERITAWAGSITRLLLLKREEAIAEANVTIEEWLIGQEEREEKRP